MGLSKDRIEHFVEHFDYHDPELGTDPYPVYAELRQRCPIHRSPAYGGHWVISKYEHAHAAFQDPGLFSSGIVSIPPELGQQRPLIPEQLDPPEHARYRRLLNPAFSIERLSKLDGFIRQRCRELLASYAESGGGDFISAFAKPYPVSIFLELLGLPQDRMEEFVGYSDRIIHGFHDDPDGELRIMAGMEVYVAFAQLIDARMNEPRDDLVSLLVHSQLDGDQLTDEEVLDICFLLFIAGLDTTTAALGQSFLHLSQHPADQQRLRDDPDVIPAAVEELVRYESPVSIARIATRDADFFGCPIKQGDWVLILTGSANRDEDEFDRADEVDFDRRAKHLGFGSGVHRCLGMHLGRLQVRVAIEEFHRLISDYQLADPAAVRRHAGPIGGIDYLPLSVVPATATATSPVLPVDA